MRSLCFILLIGLLAVQPSKQEQHAVLVAGSNEYWNYRHQADVCHAYQILIKHGVKPQNIIVMSYDDVSVDKANPFLGKLYNKPSGENPGVNVNEGCLIDYRKNQVTSQNFLAILKGEKELLNGGGSGRVLQTGPNDTLFLCFFGHGQQGLIEFPYDYLYAQDLMDTFNYMADKKKYKQIMYYMQSSYAASMFAKLPINMQIYAVSASLQQEQSWATYCTPNDVVQGKSIGACLGDEFSVNWMEDSDAQVSSVETIQKQFETVKALTVRSTVNQLGDLKFVSQPMGTFIGMSNISSLNFAKMMRQFRGREKPAHAMGNGRAQLEGKDTKLRYLMERFQQSPSADNLDSLLNELQAIKLFQAVAAQLLRYKNELPSTNILPTKDVNSQCYQGAIAAIQQRCGRIPTSETQVFELVYGLCSQVVDTGAVVTGINQRLSRLCLETK